MALDLQGRLTRGVGCDIAADALAVARQAAAHLPDGGRKLSWQAIAHPGEAPDGPFDAVLAVDVLHHIPPALQTEALAQLCQRVGAGGRLIYKDIAATPVWRRWGNSLHDLLLARQFVHYLPMERVEAVGAAQGLRLVHSRDYTCYVYPHQLRVFAREDKA